MKGWVAECASVCVSVCVCVFVHVLVRHVHRFGTSKTGKLVKAHEWVKLLPKGPIVLCLGAIAHGLTPFCLSTLSAPSLCSLSCAYASLSLCLFLSLCVSLCPFSSLSLSLSLPPSFCVCLCHLSLPLSLPPSLFRFLSRTFSFPAARCCMPCVDM